MITIIERDKESFFKVPFEIYSNDFGHVSLLKSDLARFLSLKNPLFESEEDYSFFTAFKDGKIAGRIVAHIHHKSNELYHTKRAYFGFFECINDELVARELLLAAEKFAGKHYCNELAGNFNLTAMQQIGIVTDIKIPYHYTDQVYSPVYIKNLLQKCGYTPFFPMKTYEVDVQALAPENLLGPKQKEILNNNEFTFSTLKDDPLDQMMEAMRLCLNNGFSDNPMFVPLTKEEIYFQAKDMMMVIDEYITVVAKHKGQAVGVVICIPNLNPLLKNIKSSIGLTTPYYFLKHKMQRESAIIIFYSVYKEFHSQGLNGVMLYKVMSALKQRGYKKLGGTWISDDNIASVRQTQKLNALEMHELHLFKKDIV